MFRYLKQESNLVIDIVPASPIQVYDVSQAFCRSYKKLAAPVKR